MKKRLTSLLALLLVLVMLLCACSAQNPQQNAAEPQPETTAADNTGTQTAGSADKTTKNSVVIRLLRDPDSCFTGEYANQNTQDPVEHMIVEALTQENYSDKSVIDPLLAESWEADEDGMGVTFHLRQDVYFHNGEKMTADDVVYSYATLTANSSQASVYSWIDFGGTKAIDEYTVYVPMKDYNITWADDLQFVGIYCKSYCEANKDNAELFLGGCIGTGPYQLVSWTTNDSVVLKRNDNYWGEKAIIENVTFRVISEMSVALMELQTGGIDVLLEGDYVDAMDIMNDPGSAFRVYEQPQQLQAFMGFNMHSEKIADIACGRRSAMRSTVTRLSPARSTARATYPIAWFPRSRRASYTGSRRNGRFAMTRKRQRPCWRKPALPDLSSRFLPTAMIRSARALRSRSPICLAKSALR